MQGPWLYQEEDVSFLNKRSKWVPVRNCVEHTNYQQEVFYENAWRKESPVEVGNFL